MATKTVRIDRAPPRRVLAPLAYRSFKSGPDRAVWDACWDPVRRLQADGWQMVRVLVDWGSSLPSTPAGRVDLIRDVTGCYDACVVVSDSSRRGRGEMVIEMVRDGE